MGGQMDSRARQAIRICTIYRTSSRRGEDSESE
jgi:hypothetical protein